MKSKPGTLKVVFFLKRFCTNFLQLINEFLLNNFCFYCSNDARDLKGRKVDNYFLMIEQVLPEPPPPAPVVVLQDSGQVALVLQEASRKGSSVKAEAILAHSRP